MRAGTDGGLACFDGARWGVYTTTNSDLPSDYVPSIRADASDPELLGGYAPTFAGKVAELPVASSEPLAAEIEAFLAVVRDGTKPVVSGEDGLWAVALADALLESARAHHSVDLSDLSERLRPA